MKLFFRKLGQGKPLFILHGLFGLSDNWATVGKILSEHFEVYLIDLRNHGNSPHSSEWSYSAMANDILELINDQLPNHPITLLGHSLGGKVAMQFAAMYPEKLEKLIVVDMAPKNYASNSFDLIEKLLSVNLAEIKSRKEADEKLSLFIKDKSTLQLFQKNLYWNEEEKLAWKFNLKVIAENQNKIGKTFSLGERQITTPALFMRGEKSNYILNSDTAEIIKHFPNSEIKTIAGAGHWVHADKPNEFVEEVIRFI